MASYQHPSEENDLECRFQSTIKKYNDLLLSLPNGESWGFHNLYQYQGFWLPSDPALKGVIFIQDHFNSKPDDIILATFPKSGTNWCAALIFATINRNNYDFTSHPLLSKTPRDLFNYMEQKVYNHNDSYDPFETIPSPRCLATHLPYTLLPDTMKTSGGRFVNVLRNPKDVLVSMWHFLNKSMSARGRPPISLEVFFKGFCEGVSNCGPYWDHMLSFWKASQESPEKILVLTYEDLKKEPLVQVKRLAKFLGVPFSVKEESEGVVEEIVKLCSFEKMSNLEVNKDTTKQNFFGNSDFFRKGEVGDWMNYLTPEMAARLDQITKEKFEGSGLMFY